LLGAEVFGLSVQPTEYQREFHGRLNLPFDLLSDEDLAFSAPLALPSFTVESLRLLKRLTLISCSGIIERVFYPIFPPDTHAAEVVSYLKNRKPGKPAG
jgi:peroxiredoxin